MMDVRVRRAAGWLHRNVELSSLLILVAVVLAVWGFAELADEVGEGATQSLDRDLLLALRVPGDPSDPLGPGWIEEMGRDVTALGSFFAIAASTFAVAGFFLLSGRPGTTLYLLVAVGGGILISSLAKGLFERPRPELVPHGAEVFTTSFPSGHSMMAAVAYLTIAALVSRALPRRRLKIYVLSIAVLLTVLVGASRVYLGVHWPTDVLAGWLAGAGWAILCLAVARALARRGRIEPEAKPPDAPDPPG